jgi:hypothetical protein
MTIDFFYDKEKRQYVKKDDDTNRMNYLASLTRQSNYYAYQGFELVTTALKLPYNIATQELIRSQYARMFEHHLVQATVEFSIDKRSGRLKVKPALIKGGFV